MRTNALLFMLLFASPLTAQDSIPQAPAEHPPSLEMSAPLMSPIPRRSARAANQEWTYHKTPDGLHPSGMEQAMLWLTNIARQNPPAEGIWLATASETEIAQPRNYFSVDTTMLRNEFDSYTPTPPAAFDVRLYRAAYNHSLDLIARDAQDHNGQFERVTAQNFNYSGLGGNVFSYADNALNAHAGFNIDWGSEPGGMQAGRGHRVNKMSINKNFSNVGIAIVPESNPSTNVGPYVVTENYGSAWGSDGTHFNRFLVGTVWKDSNGNARYDDGEGFANVSVTPAQGSFYAITGNAGGYAVPLTVEGSYTVTFSGGPFSQAVTKTILVRSNSVLLDYQVQGSTGGTTNYVLNVSKTGSGTVSATGLVCGSTCSASYASGSLVTLTATPDSGYTFSGWSGACSGSQACSVSMNSAQTVTANFSAITDTLLSSGVPVTTSVGKGAWQYYRINASATHTRLSVKLSSLSADADVYVRNGAQPTETTYACRPFSGGTAEESCVLSNTAAGVWYIGVNSYTGSTYTLTASLSAETASYPLSVITTGTGSVSSTPAGIDCGSSCSYNYAGGTAVVLTATAADGYEFSAWGGACSGTQTTCSVTLSSAKSVSATFAQLANNMLSSGVAVTASVAQDGWQYYQISAGAEHTNVTVQLSGLLTDLDLYVNKGAQPTATLFECSPYLEGTATETCILSNSGANTWYIGVNGYQAGSYTLTASLSSASTYALNVSKTGSGGVFSSPNGIDCGSDCSHTYASGTVVNLTAVAAADYSFVGWGGACAGTQSTCSVTVTANLNVSASFTANTSNNSLLSSGVTRTGEVAVGTWKNYTITADSSHTQLKVELFNLTGDADLLVQKDSPVINSADCISENYLTAAESCVLDNTSATTWYISVYGYESSSYSLKATLTGGASSARLINISTRAQARGGADDVFAAFVVQGSGTKRVIVRGLGVNGSDTALSVLNITNATNHVALGGNDNWQSSNPRLSEIQALPAYLQPQLSTDSGLLLDLTAGVYSVIVSSRTNTGQVVVGVDDVGGSGDAKLINISTRAQALGGADDIFAAFVIQGDGSLPVMIRGLGVNGTDTTLNVLNITNSSNHVALGTNDNWASSLRSSEIQALPAYLQPQTSTDSGLLLDLPAGVYAAVIGSRTNSGQAVAGVDALR